MKKFFNEVWIGFLTRLFALLVLLTEKVGAKLLKAKNLDVNKDSFAAKLSRELEDQFNLENHKYPYYDDCDIDFSKFHAQILKHREKTVKLRKDELKGSFKVAKNDLNFL